MSNLRQAAEMALEALENKRYVSRYSHIVGAITTLRAALAEDALQRLTDVQQEIDAALAEPNKCTHGVTDGNCKECYMAESEQEPVAWMDREGDLYKMPEIKNWAPPHKMLYTASPQRKPLSEEEIGKAWSVADGEHNASAAVKRRITRAIEQAHGIKGEA